LKSWNSLNKRAGVSDLQPKDLRTYFNTVLKNKYGFTSKEAGFYTGNSKTVNELHYSPISSDQMKAKMDICSLENVVGISECGMLVN